MREEKILQRDLFLVCLLLLFLILFISGCTTTQTIKQIEQETAIVTKIIDGDTVIIQGGNTVRLLGIDTPEKGEPFYNQAKNYLEEKILYKQVILEKDKDNKDRYGRLLRWVWLNNSLINLEMVKEGFAVARFYENSKYQSLIAEAEKQAAESKIGLWQQLNQNNQNVNNNTTNISNTKNYSTIYNIPSSDCVALGCPKGTKYVASKNSAKFHLCSCSFAKKIKPENLICFKTREEALDKGYIPCSSCKP